MKIFGREPAFYVGLVEAVLAVLLSWNQFSLTADTVGAIMAVVTAALGFYTAYVTHDTLLGVGVGLVKALIALFVAYGLRFDTNQTAAIIGLATIVLGAWNRTQTKPLVNASFTTGRK